MKTGIIKRTIREILLFVILFGLTFYIIFKDQDFTKIFSIIGNANLKYIFLGILFMFLYFLTESYNVKKILKSFGDKVSLFKMLKFTFIGFFFSAITPAASGGQPMEIYYMSKEKISGPNATLALLIQLCGFQIGTILLGVTCAIINPHILNRDILWLYILGISINVIALTVMLIGVFSKKLTEKMVNLFINILKFFRFNKLDSKKDKIEESLHKYNESSNYIKSHKKEFVKSVLRVFIQIIFYHLIPFCVYKAFGLSNCNIFKLFTMQAVLYSTVSSLPLPGAVGISEAVFISIFHPVFGKKLIKSALILNRGINFYLYLLLSLIVASINAIRIKRITSNNK